LTPQAFSHLEAHPLYVAVLLFFGFYPIISSIIWITTSILYWARRERKPKASFYELDEPPPVSILIPAYCEGIVIRRTLEGVLAIDYPDFEVVVVDDASTDNTVAEVMPLVEAGRVRLIRKGVNEGKAMALNDAIPCLRGDLVLIMDADAYPDPMILRVLVPHFRSARVGAVTGNPKVANRETFLSKLQIIEFTSIVSLLRRAQRVWGRILTMSGVVGIFRKSALIDAGLYSPEMATEDIDISWKIQKRFYDIRYEARAIVWMQVPPGFARLWRQRIRWAKGLAQVLRRHSDVLIYPRYRRLWPVYLEATLSILWAYCVIVLFGFWALSYAIGYLPYGVSGIPGWWGMLIATMCLLQLTTGAILEGKYDKDVFRHFPISVFYPIVYWMLLALVTAISTPSGFFGPLRRGRITRWRTDRDRPGHAAA
jgi:biofilm PGA synthesis N-glycosyltransferase PgaC